MCSTEDFFRIVLLLALVFTAKFVLFAYRKHNHVAGDVGHMSYEEIRRIEKHLTKVLTQRR